MPAQRKHCLLIHQAFVAPNEVGGTRHIELMRQLNHGWSFTVVAGAFAYITGQRVSNELPLPENVRVVRAWVPPGLTRFTVLRIIGFFCFMATSFIKALAARDVDVVWGTVPSTFQGFTALFVARLKRKPFVLEVRDLWPDFAIAAGVLRNRAVFAIGRWLERTLYRSADRIIVNSPGFIDHVASKGVERDRITLIVNGVTTDDFVGGDGGALRHAWSVGEGVAAVYAGSHGPAMDLDTVLSAAEQLADDDNITLVLIGDGREKPRLQERAIAQGIDNVVFADAVPKQQMRDVLAAADVCIAILRDRPEFKTTYPNKVFDYMAAAKPTVLVIDGPIREVIECSGGGSFVPPGRPDELAKAIRAYASDAPRRQREGEAARTYVRAHFDRRRQAEDLDVLLRDVIARTDGANRSAP